MERNIGNRHNERSLRGTQELLITLLATVYGMYVYLSASMLKNRAGLDPGTRLATCLF